MTWKTKETHLEAIRNSATPHKHTEAISTFYSQINLADNTTVYCKRTKVPTCARVSSESCRCTCLHFMARKSRQVCCNSLSLILSVRLQWTYNKTQPVAQTDTGDEPCWICSASMQRRKVEQISRKRRKQTLIIDSLLIGLLIPRSDEVDDC